jgi:hypothetical protein
MSRFFSMATLAHSRTFHNAMAIVRPKEEALLDAPSCGEWAAPPATTVIDGVRAILAT